MHKQSIETKFWHFLFKFCELPFKTNQIIVSSNNISCKQGSCSLTVFEPPVVCIIFLQASKV